MEQRLIRRATALTAGALALALSTSCGAEPAGDGEGAAAGGGFPVTVETVHGDVEIAEKPTDVVALGWSDAEAALALGVQPVGLSDWQAYGGKGVGPWAEDLLDAEPADLGTMEVSAEAVANLDPDVVLNTRSDGQESTLSTVREFVPVVDPPQGVEVSYGTTWRQQMTQVSLALGEVEKGEELIADLEARFAEVAAEHPEFEGRTVAVGAFYGDRLGAYVPGDSRVDFMEELGFESKPEINDLAGDEFYVDLGLEEVETLDADLTVVFPIGMEAAELADNELLNSIPSARDGRLVVLDDPDLVNAFSSGSTLGIAHALDEAPQVFSAALGD
ncbi:ABC transporter substrate-binding protein [Nocardiopsis mangrovi]|uniref:ABC transporter substrate-binding protein n=1 Tax=Nocardiopsis mangrovi TaxID=1179818 RepID=A0ABV9DU74_9ACTN